MFRHRLSKITLIDPVLIHLYSLFLRYLFFSFLLIISPFISSLLHFSFLSQFLFYSAYLLYIYFSFFLSFFPCKLIPCGLMSFIISTKLFSGPYAEAFVFS